ncbi:MAG: HAMP domain-containing sensor histidine kinase [Leptospira sp.]|nr:HAMP domain-containing sensor histidine kinase [Leptospira sp.]
MTTSFWYGERKRLKGSARFRMIFAVSWLTLTLSLGIWWWVLGLRQARTIAEISTNKESHKELERVNRMLKLEGTFFLFMLGVGGVTLASFSYRDYRRALLITDFFSTVTHEMKTPLASLQLQVEALLEDHPNSAITEKFKKLLKENKRIESRMDKAFYLASLMQGEKLYIEPFAPKELFDSLQIDYPNVQIAKNNFQGKVKGDKKALDSILKNLFENSILHGQATNIQVHFENEDDTIFSMIVSDNGKGFYGKRKELTKPFKRHTQTSGTGIGLYIAKKLMDKMNGKLTIPNVDKGFSVILSLKIT